jgi:hypothetical protein
MPVELALDLAALSLYDVVIVADGEEGLPGVLRALQWVCGKGTEATPCGIESDVSDTYSSHVITDCITYVPLVSCAAGTSAFVC